ncbi:MAG: DGQHR domain-containing protein [candidate division Zixibacteria bacterium]|nr:DGQHR domain-containing protein [candidate division Zixibacteria bacterium]
MNRRVWQLFESAGFETHPNSQDDTEEIVYVPGTRPRPIDLSAEIGELGVKIIGQNSSGKHKGISKEVNDIRALRKSAKAQAALLVFTGKQITKEDMDSMNQGVIRCWGIRELEYYESLVETIGPYAKFEIIHSFGLKTTEERSIHTALALKIKQPNANSGQALYVFSSYPEFLLRTAAVYRKAQGNADAYQRMIRKRRLSKIRDFVQQNDALMPPSLIVHFGNKVTWKKIETDDLKHVDGDPITLSRGDCELGVLYMPKEYASIEIIDGQHRLYGFVNADQATKDSFNLAVIGLKDLDTKKKSQTFVSINNEAKKMDPNLVCYLKYTKDEEACKNSPELMAIRIVVDLNSLEPFKNKIRLVDVETAKFTLKGFSGADLRSLIGQRGLLRKYYTNEPKELIKALRLYFNVVKSIFKDEWKDENKYILATNRGLIAFLKLLKSILKTCDSELSKGIIEKYLKALKKNWKLGWEIKKLKGQYVGAAGMKKFHEDILKKIRKTYHSFGK